MGRAQLSCMGGTWCPPPALCPDTHCARSRSAWEGPGGLTGCMSVEDWRASGFDCRRSSSGFPTPSHEHPSCHRSRGALVQSHIPDQDQRAHSHLPAEHSGNLLASELKDADQRWLQALTDPGAQIRGRDRFPPLRVSPRSPSAGAPLLVSKTPAAVASCCPFQPGTESTSLATKCPTLGCH